MVLVSTGRNAGRGKVVYSWISPDPAKAGPTLGVVVVVVGLNVIPKQVSVVKVCH